MTRRTGDIRRGDGFVTERPQRDGTVRFQARWREDDPQRGVVWRARTFTTREAAEDHLRQLGRDRRAGRYVPESRLTISGLVEEYLERGRHRWSASTVAAYRQLAASHITPHLGSRRVVDLTPRMVQSWIDTLVRSGLSASTVNNARIVLSGACKEATRLGVIGANPVAGVRIPKRARVTRTAWTREEAATVLETVRDDVLLHAYYLTALTSGMRPGELRALQWGDIDTARGTIHCQRTMTRDERFSPIVGTGTKTGRTRHIAVPQETVAALALVRREQLARRMAAAAWHDTGLVFDRGDGRYLPLTTLDRWHRDVIARAGVRPIRLHDLRHSAATLLLEAGINIKVVSEILGHASITTTLDVYAHVSEDLQREAVELLTGRLVRERA